MSTQIRLFLLELSDLGLYCLFMASKTFQLNFSRRQKQMISALMVSITTWIQKLADLYLHCFKFSLYLFLYSFKKTISTQ